MISLPFGTFIKDTSLFISIFFNIALFSKDFFLSFASIIPWFNDCHWVLAPHPRHLISESAGSEIFCLEIKLG